MRVLESKDSLRWCLWRHTTGIPFPNLKNVRDGARNQAHMVQGNCLWQSNTECHQGTHVYNKTCCPDKENEEKDKRGLSDSLFLWEGFF